LHLDCSGRLVARENYHVTLAFVGDVEQSRLAQLQQIGAQQRPRAGSVEFDAIEYWPEAAVVAAVASRAPSAVLDLWNGLHDALVAARLIPSPGERAMPRTPLRMHVTLARKVTQAPVMQAMSPLLWRVRAFSLVQSDLGRTQPVYTVVDTWSLLDETPKA
jgi:2'-5' RNA ligase